MYQVQHYRKIQTAIGLRNVIAHNMRENVYDKEGNEIANDQTEGKWYVPEMAGHNRYSEDIKKAEQVLKKRADRIKEANLTRKPQKNAAHAIEGFYSASAEFAAEWRDSGKDQDTWKKYLEQSQKWAEKEFGKENVLHVSMHMDEKTPHLHVVVVPIMEKEGRNVYSSSNFLKGPKGIAKLHTNYHKKVGKKYGLDRGKEGSRASHQDLKTFKQREEKLKEREDLVEKKAHEVVDNKHLLNSDLGSEYEPDVAPTLLNKISEFTTTDGKERLPYKKYLKYEEQLHKDKYIKKLELQNKTLFRDNQTLRYHYQLSEEELGKTKEQLKEYQNMSPNDHRAMADKMEKQQTLNNARDKDTWSKGSGLV